MAIGFRIYPRTRQVPAAIVDRFRELPVACVSDVMLRMSAAGARLRPMHAGGVLAGPALTVRTRPGDNLMLHAALNRAGRGDVIVVDAGGDLTNSLIGGLMTAYAESIGVAGVVVNGAIRDAGVIGKGKFPVYAAGVTHRGPYKDGPGEINVAIAIGGMAIAPGDLVLGDEDGVVCVPFEETETVLEAASSKAAAAAETLAAIRAGTSDRSWVEAALVRLGCEGLQR
jgi:RraA family protein